MRILNCYGPQEVNQAQRQAAEQKDAINQFWVELEMEVIKAKDEGCLVLIELDANAKVGKEAIHGDPHEVSENGKLLIDFAERQSLKILNSSSKCSGVITRERVTVDRTEKSVIDFILACEELASLLESMVIDDVRTHVLTKYASTKGHIKKVEIYHNVLHASLSLSYKPGSKKRDF